jgi:hypothetical protein
MVEEVFFPLSMVESPHSEGGPGSCPCRLNAHPMSYRYRAGMIYIAQQSRKPGQFTGYTISSNYSPL